MAATFACQPEVELRVWGRVLRGKLPSKLARIRHPWRIRFLECISLDLHVFFRSQPLHKYHQAGILDSLARFRGSTFDLSPKQASQVYQGTPGGVS